MVVPGFRDAAIKEYCDWQQSKVVNPSVEGRIPEGADVAIENGLDLEQIYKHQDPSFSTEKGVMLGIIAGAM